MDKANNSILGYSDIPHPRTSEEKKDSLQNKGYKSVPLKELLTLIQGPEEEGYTKEKKYLSKSGDLRRTSLKSFRYGYLHPPYNTFRPVYTANDISLTCNTRQITSNHYYILDRVTLIYNKDFSQPVLFTPAHGAIYIDKDTYYPFDIKTELINPFYLINELVKEYVSDQIKTNKQKQPTDTPLDKLLSVHINIPDCQNTLERQRQIYTYEKQIMVAELFKAFNMDIDSMSNTDASALPTGSIVGKGRYKLLSVIDSGGFSFTYKAIDMQNANKEIAIKEFFIRGLHTRDNNFRVVPQLSSKIEYLKKAREKFWAESDKIKEFSQCPNIVEVYDLFDENGTCYYTMEYINGCDLFYYVKSLKNGSLPEKEALGIIKDVCKAVKTMHDGRMNHLDIKPENIMFEFKTQRIVLIDFGSATQNDDRESSILNCYSNGYTPAEYMTIHDFCPQKDIYAIGATLYFLITGETPPSALELLKDSTRMVRPENISEHTWNIISSAMQYNYLDRPSSIDELKLTR